MLVKLFALCVGTLLTFVYESVDIEQGQRPRYLAAPDQFSTTAVFTTNSALGKANLAANQPAPIRLPAKEQQSIYKCQQKAGTSIFSDRPCGNSYSLINKNALQPTIADAYQAPTQQAYRSETNKARQSALPIANSHEINTRYDNLSRTLYSLFERNEQNKLKRALSILEQDRAAALTMKSSDHPTYAAQIKFNNLSTDAHHQLEGVSLAYELLRIERMRNEALYLP